MLEPMLVDTPSIYPGQCVDGRQDGPMIDTLYEPAGYGRVYLSRPMVRDAARLLGPELLHELVTESGRYVEKAELDAAIAERDAARDDVKALEQLSLATVRKAGREMQAAAL